MKSKKGIAIVAALGILVVILALGVGSLFLTNVNLGISKNLKTKILAKAQAESTLDATLIYLDQQVIANEKFPDSYAVPSLLINDIAIDLNQNEVGYSVDTGNLSGEIKVIGSSINNSNHFSEARLWVGSSNGSADETSGSFYNGLVSEGVIKLNGKSYFISAGVHGNKGYEIKNNGASFFICTERYTAADGVATNLLGTCKTTVAIDSNKALPVSASATEESWTCEPSRNSNYCVDGKPTNLSDPVNVEVDYDGVLSSAVSNAHISTGGTTSHTFGIDCTHVFNSVTGLNSLADVAAAGLTWDTSVDSGKRTICVHGNVTFPSGVTLENLNLIASGQIQFNGNQSVDIINSTIVSTQSGVNLSRGSVKNSTVVSRNDMNWNGQGLEVIGKTTIASHGNITINGSSNVTDVDGNTGIGVTILSEGNITLNGSANWFALLMAEGTAIVDGNSSFIGGIVSASDITINGGIDLDAGLDFLNLPDDEEGVVASEIYGVDVLSRR